MAMEKKQNHQWCVFLWAFTAGGLTTACNVQLISPTTQGGTTSSSGNPDLPLPSPSTQTLNFNASRSGSFTLGSSAGQFAAADVELASTTTDASDSSTAGFGAAALTGAIWDGSGSYVRLNQGGTPTNVTALDPSWTPEWSSIKTVLHLDGSGSLNNGLTVADASGSGNVATISGAGLAYAPAQLAQGVQFDEGDTLQIPYTSSTNVCGDFTLMFWINWNASNSTNYASLVTNQNACDGGSSFGMVQYNGTQQILLGMTSANGTASYWTDEKVLDGNWHLVTLTLAGGNSSIYVDGNYDNGQSFNAGSGVCSAGPPLSIGAGGCTEDAFGGVMDEFAIWSKALTPAEIALIYKRQSAKYSGTIASRVMDAQASKSWPTFAWTSTLPFGKPLADNGATESAGAYSATSGSSLESGLQALWHLDGTLGSLGSYQVVEDSSGNSANGLTMNANGTGLSYVYGKLGQGWAFDGNDDAVIVPEAWAPNPATDFTLSLWERFNPLDTNSTINIVSKLNAGTAGWALERCGNGGSVQFRVDTSAATDQVFCSTGTPLDETYHHVVVTMTGGTGSIYIDGALDSHFTYSAGTGFASTANLLMGNTSSSFAGILDEIGVWNRALSSTEVTQLYRRAANRLAFQVRTCADATCTSGSPAWVGPDGTNTTFFSELNNTLANAVGAAVQAAAPLLTFADFANVSLSAERYFQYRAFLETDDHGSACNYGAGATWCSPELQSVSAAPSYSENGVVVTSTAALTVAKPQSFSETLGGQGCSAGVVYELSADATHWLYWNGSAWSAANGTAAQANAAAAVSPEISAFPIGAASSLYVKAFLQTNGSTPCQLSAITVSGG